MLLQFRSCHSEKGKAINYSKVFNAINTGSSATLAHPLLEKILFRNGTYETEVKKLKDKSSTVL